jgi:DNA helicase-2/ATP-dependent DNA helicase PcrA
MNDTKVWLSTQQEVVVSHVDGPMLVVAGPGSGKTRVLTERVRRLLTTVDGHFRILALTFTNKAADEMKERLADLGEERKRAFIGTLHGFCLDLLTERGKFVGVIGVPHIFEHYKDRKDILVKAVAEDPALSEYLSDMDAREQGAKLEEWMKSIGYLKSHPITAASFEDEVGSRVLQAYNAGLRACDAYDFDDLLELAYRLLTEQPALADFYRRIYRFVCVDEAQDLNEAQYAVISALCGADFKNVMMVGDPKQSIYGFNTAGPQYMQKFALEFGALTAELTDNFRCSKAVVDAARALDSKYHVQGQLPIAGECLLYTGTDEANEAELVVGRLLELATSGHPDVEGAITPSRCAVLARNRFALLAVEKELKEKGIPYYKRLTANHENESSLVEDFQLAMRVMVNPRDRLHYTSLAGRWKVATAQPAATTAEAAITGLALSSGLEDAKVAAEAAAVAFGGGDKPNFIGAFSLLKAYGDKLAEENRRAVWEDVKVFELEWDQYLRSEGAGRSVSGFLSSKALGSTQRAVKDGVGLLTVHSAKGLEFDVVAIVGMAEGIFPDYRARTPKEQQEEARSAFVAVTRSRRLLYFSYPQLKMMPWGDTKRQQPSRFLRQVGFKLS